MSAILRILCILFAIYMKNTRGSYTNHNYLKFRNLALRMLLSDEYATVKKMFRQQQLSIKLKYLVNQTEKKILKLYDATLSNYYDTYITYSSMAENDKLIIETILSLCY